MFHFSQSTTVNSFCIFQENDTYGVIEVGLWILRVFIALCGMISTQSLYRYLSMFLFTFFVYSAVCLYFSILKLYFYFSKWRDQKTVLKSLQSLNVVSEKTLLLYVKEVGRYLPTYVIFYTKAVISFQKRSKGQVLPCRNHNYSIIFY